MFIVFDLDGTLADDTHRQHFLEQHPKDWDSYFAACGDDPPIQPVVELLYTLSQRHDVQVWTGRSEKYRQQTVEWFRSKGLWWSINNLVMRPVGDYRPDTVLKGEWLAERSKPDLIFDDRNKSVRFWREQGIVCLQVADHDY